MATGTKGFVMTKCKDVFFVCDRIERALNKLIQPGWTEQRFSPQAADEKAHPQFERVSMKLSASSGSVQFRFAYQGEYRTLWVNFHCDWDQREYGPASISLSLNRWGDSELFMKTALQSISMLGPVYFDADDCDSVRPAMLDLCPPSFISACAAGGEYGSFVTLRQWHAVCQRGEMRAGTFQDWLGMSVGTLNEILKADYPASQALIDNLVFEYTASNPPAEVAEV